MKIQKAVILGLVLSAFSITNAFAFTDISGNDEKAKAINLMAEYKIVNGYKDGTFRPSGEITRAEFVKMTNKLFNYKEKAISENFSDINEKDWYYDDVLKAMNEGYLLGFEDGTFRPNDKITKEQVCIILDRILNLEKTVTKKELVIKDKVSNWALNSVKRVIAIELMELDAEGNFGAKEPARRDVVALTYANTVNKDFVKIDQKEKESSGITSGGSEVIDKSEKEVLATMKLASERLRTKGKWHLETVSKRGDLYTYLEEISLKIDAYTENQKYDIKGEAQAYKANIKGQVSLEEKNMLKSAVLYSFDLSDPKEYKALEEVAKFFDIDINKVK